MNIKLFQKTNYPINHLQINAINNSTNNIKMSDQRYNLRGVSASKEDVHNAIKNIDKDFTPKHFAKLFLIFWETTLIIAILCMPILSAQIVRSIGVLSLPIKSPLI